MSFLLSELESNIGYTFENTELLEAALTHSSYANEQDEAEVSSNERLEFLGDAALGLETALLIFEKGPHLSEGEMTQVRAAIVRSETLAEMARKIELGRFLKLGIGADKTDVRENDNALEDAFEALIAAVYLDGGAEAARTLIRRFFADIAEDLIQAFPGDAAAYDYKSVLQITLQSQGPADIRYTVLNESGPDHDKRFFVAVMSGDDTLGTGEGKTKKNAEKMAAKMALEGLHCI